MKKEKPDEVEENSHSIANLTDQLSSQVNSIIKI